MPKPQAKELFSQRELAQFGVTARPQISLSDSTKLELQLQDPRTEEQKEEDHKRQEAAQTLSMFVEEDLSPSPELIRRGEMLAQAVETCRQLLATLEMLQKVKGRIDSFIPAVIEQAAQVQQTVAELGGPQEKEPIEANKSKRQLRSRSSYTVLLVDGIQVIRPY